MSANSPFLTTLPLALREYLSYLPCLVTDIQFQLQIIAQRSLLRSFSFFRNRTRREEGKKIEQVSPARESITEHKESRSTELRNNPKIHPSYHELEILDVE